MVAVFCPKPVTFRNIITQSQVSLKNANTRLCALPGSSYHHPKTFWSAWKPGIQQCINQSQVSTEYRQYTSVCICWTISPTTANLLDCLKTGCFSGALPTIRYRLNTANTRLCALAEPSATQLKIFWSAWEQGFSTVHYPQSGIGRIPPMHVCVHYPEY